MALRLPKSGRVTAKRSMRLAMPASAVCTLVGLLVDIAGLPQAVERDLAWLTAPGKPSNVLAWVLYIAAALLLVTAITSREKPRR